MMGTDVQPDKSETSIWVFGYGSLIHTPNFLYNQRLVGHIRGYRRVFWQGSTDHRGTPERPGRTVTLTSENHPAAVTWGVAFQLAGTSQEQAAALSYLEWREKQYDVRQLVDVYGADGQMLVRGALVYIASSANQNYLGPADTHLIAAQIATSRGPSGPNWEYLCKLADAMRGIGAPDRELFALEDMVRKELVRQQQHRSVDGLPAAAAEGPPGVASLDPLADMTGELRQGTAAGAAEDGGDVKACRGRADFRRWHMIGQPRLPDATEFTQQVDLGLMLNSAAEFRTASEQASVLKVHVRNDMRVPQKRIKVSDQSSEIFVN